MRGFFYKINKLKNKIINNKRHCVSYKCVTSKKIILKYEKYYTYFVYLPSILNTANEKLLYLLECKLNLYFGENSNYLSILSIV